MVLSVSSDGPVGSIAAMNLTRQYQYWQNSCPVGRRTAPSALATEPGRAGSSPTRRGARTAGPRSACSRERARGSSCLSAVPTQADDGATERAPAPSRTPFSAPIPTNHTASWPSPDRQRAQHRRRRGRSPRSMLTAPRHWLILATDSRGSRDGHGDDHARQSTDNKS